MVKKRVIAIIPARGGSKRIPNKNCVDFIGKPLITHTINAAINSKVFDEIVVSTDDQLIADISINLGASVPFLRDKFADDFTPVSQACLYALKQAEKYFRKKYDVVVQLMPNCPLRNSQDIINAYQEFKLTLTSFQISCFEYGFMNPWWAIKLKKDKTGEKLFPEFDGKRSQDLESLFCPTGAIWIANTKELKKTGSFYTSNTTYFPLSWMSAIDIDTFEDLTLAKAVYSLKKI